MLEYYVKCPKRLERLRAAPLDEHTEGLATRLHRLGFTRKTGQRILGLTGRLNEFAAGSGIEDATGVDARLVERFINEELRAEGSFRQAESYLKHLLNHLRAEGLIPGVGAVCLGADASLLGKYDTYLRDVRGLTRSTRQRYQGMAQRLLDWYQERHRGCSLASLTGVDVLDYVTQLADLHPSGSWRNNLCSLTRVFLRFLHWEGIVDNNLDRVVPTVPRRRLQSIPRHLPWEQVEALISSVDTSTPSGLRDKAVLLSIATLGLRNQEVRNLHLGDIRWRAGEIRLAETKSRRERALPLPDDVGTAIAEYVIHGRPRQSVPHVFLRHRAPQGPITSTHGIGEIVKKHLLRAGIQAPSYGAHVLRHSLATKMVNQGVPIKEIADVLGHVSIDTTAIYTKVDTGSLAAVALPFPGGDA